MRMLNTLYNQMEQESLSLILDTDKTRQMYLKGWKCIWARQRNNKSQFTSFRLRPSFLHCAGPEGRDTPCGQGLGSDQKRKHSCGSQDCRVLSVLWPCSVWAGCQPSGHRVDVLSGERTLSVLQSMSGRREITRFAPFPEVREVILRWQRHCLPLRWGGVVQLRVGWAQQMPTHQAWNNLPLEIHLGKTRGVVRDAQLVSMPPFYVVMLPERSRFSVPSKATAVITVRRKVFMFFPQTASSTGFSVSSVRLRGGHQAGLRAASVRLQELGRDIGTSKKRRSFLP